MDGAWTQGFPIQPNTFGQPFGNAQPHEDWEDWLRWDPAAEAASPEDGTMNSGSSKNDSPIQDAVFPMETELFGGKANEALAPPLIMGEDDLDFGDQTVAGNEPFLFGDSIGGLSNFGFQPMMAMEQPHSSMPKIDTNTGTWQLPSNIDAQSINLSALSNEGYHSLPSAGTVSSNAPSLHYSPESTSQVRTSIASNSPDPPKKRGGRKRKADVEREQREQREQNEENSQEDGDEPPVKKTSHNVIEKRYRNNLNDKIVELRNSVPSLRAMGRPNGGDESEDLEGLTPAHKLNKATVMGKATEYIKHLEKRNKNMADEMTTLKARLNAVEAAIGKNKDRQASMSGSPPGASMRPRQTSSSSQNGAPGFLNVPQEQTRFGQQVVQQQYMQSQSQPAYGRAPNPPVEAQNQSQFVNARRGGIRNKVALGAMASVMVMEGFSEQQQQAGGDTSMRGLAAFPLHLLKRGLDTPLPSSPAALSKQLALPLLKIFLVIGVLLYLLAPIITFSPLRKPKARQTAVRLPHAPSLASPIEVRRKAWLTAIQSVWVPKHFLLEVVAVTLQMINLSVRRLIGTEAYNTLTGANKDDEVARIKAWDIAIDAQLAGGDQEVSYYRLLLTLMESGTLPDSPTRLMQKAVHFRVFFWDVANAGYGNMIGFKQFTEKVGKLYWDHARRQQKELMYAKSQGRPSQDDEEVELLPDHLASLIDLDCDEVLDDEMIQRAWNLAWNKPSAYNAIANVAKDAVIEDHAIRSPLDAVAAWYANLLVDETLAESVSANVSTLDTEYYIGLAVSIAPPASGTLARALAAKAVLSNMNREANIATALEAMPAVTPSSGEMNVVSHMPASPDVLTALTLAKLLALISPNATPVARSRALNTVASWHMPPGSFTLLTSVATFRLLKAMTGGVDDDYSIGAKHGLEDLAANLRVWVGTSAGRQAGMGKEQSAQVVEMSLDVAKKIGGWEERDSGYGSAEGSPVRTSAEVSLVH